MSLSQVTVQEFIVYFSPNELMGKYYENGFTFFLDGSGGAATAFELETTDVTVPLAYPAGSVPNALVTSGDASGLYIGGVYTLTLSVSGTLNLMMVNPIVNFNVSIVEGKLY